MGADEGKRENYFRVDDDQSEKDLRAPAETIGLYELRYVL